MKKLAIIGRQLSRSEQKNLAGGTIPYCGGNSTNYICRYCMNDDWGEHGGGTYCWCDVLCVQSGQGVPEDCWLYNQVPWGACP
jgi:hypothetical protein